jgi:transposase
MKREVEEGVPIARIAREYGVSRQSVFNVLKGATGPAAEPVRVSKLDPFKPYVRERLDRFDLPATVLLRELRKRGFEGGITILKDFVRDVKGAAVRRVVEWSETEPGRQERYGAKIARSGSKTAKRTAVVAVARKLAVLLHALWASGEIYEPLRNTSARRKRPPAPDA